LICFAVQLKKFDTMFYLVNDMIFKKENNMKKPKICELLEVEIGERFMSPFDGADICIDDSGLPIFPDYKEKKVPAWYIVDMINKPNTIIRKQHFTLKEIIMAQNLLEAVGDGELKQVGDMTTLKVDGKIIYLREGAFPSLKQGQAIKLSSIIETQDTFYF